jgi:putative ABC transport system permease protein
LGANRRHIIGQLLSESVTIALIGGVIGFPMAVLATAVVKQLVPPDVPRFQEFGIDGGSLLFVVGVTIFAAFGSGLLPAWVASRTDVSSSLKEEGSRAGTAGPRRQRGLAVLVTAQIALTCLLLIAASLLTRSFVAIENAPLGFKTDHIVTADLYLGDAKYSTQAESRVFLDALVDKLQHLPGIISVGFSDNLPFKGENRLSFGIESQPDPEPWKLPVWQAQTVSADFLKTLGIPILRGRGFSEQGEDHQRREVIVSERLADSIFPGQEAIGKQLHDYNSSGRQPNWYTIVGIVPNIQHSSPGADRTPYQAYFLYSQDPFAPWPVSFCTLVLHTEVDSLALAGLLRRSVASIDPNIPLYHIDAFDHVIEQSLAGRRLGMTVVSLFSIVALMLAGVGLYGVISYSIAQRRREIGVRMALGAQASRVVGLIMSQGLKIVLVGLAVGVVIALSLGHLLDSMLYEVSAVDPLSIGISVLVLGLSALVACLLPARRATQIDPMTALRE